MRHENRIDSEQAILKNAPSQHTPFVGRASDIDAITKLIRDPTIKLVTLLGPGGSGKTRLAITVAMQCAAEFQQGAVFVGLQGMNDDRLFIATISKALGLPTGTQQTVEQSIERLAQYLEDHPMLIVLDNVEHLLKASDDLAHLLQLTPRTHFITTSRERLNLQEEYVYLIQGLQFPTHDLLKNNSKNRATYDAVQLFAERAKRVQSGFDLDNELEAVVRICQSVEGMPLALELAASWCNVLASSDIATELEHGMDMLSTQLKNVPERHKSMNVIFEQTWRNLSEYEQKIYARLTVFQGGFQKDAAQKIASASLLNLSALHNHAIIRLDHSGRYYIHELIRQYGRERLAENPVEEQTILANYANYFADYVHDRLPEMSGGNQLETSMMLGHEIDNIRTSIQLAFEKKSTGLIARLCNESLALFFQHESRYLEALQTFQQAESILRTKSKDDETNLARLNVLKSLTWFQLRLGYFEEILETTQQAMTLYQSFVPPPTYVHLSDPRMMLAFAELALGRYEQAIELATDILKKDHVLNQQVDQQFAHYVLADAYQAKGKMDDARYHAQKSYDLTQDYGDHWFSAYVLNKLGLFSRFAGDIDAARQFILKSHNIREKFGDIEGVALSLSYLGDVELQDKNYQEAQTCFKKSLHLYERINDTGGLATSHQGLGLAAYMLGDSVNAQKHILKALDLATEIEYLYLLSILFIILSHWLWQKEEQGQSLILLAFVSSIHHPDDINFIAAESALKEYQQSIDEQVFADMTAKGNRLSLQDVVNNLKLILRSQAIFEREEIFVEEDTMVALTAREIDVLTLLVEGLSNPEIAEKLMIAVGTVKYHTSQIYNKLEVNSRIEAVHKAQTHDLILP